MRRLVSTALVAGLVSGAALFTTGGVASAQTGNVAAFCQARVDAEAAAGRLFNGDKSAQAAFDDSLARLTQNAPAAISTQANTVATALKTKGLEKAFDDPAVSSADAALSAFVAGNCGFPVVKVTAIDYQFTGLPTTMKAGVTVFQLTDGAPLEQHEIVLIKRKPGVTDKAAKILALSEKKIVKKVDFITGTDPAKPGATAYAITKLEPGEYIATCFLPQGGKKKGKPHFKLGMIAEFTVTA